MDGRKERRNRLRKESPDLAGECQLPFIFRVDASINYKGAS